MPLVLLFEVCMLFGLPESPLELALSNSLRVLDKIQITNYPSPTG